MHWWGFSLNEGEFPNVHISWRWRDAWCLVVHVAISKKKKWQYMTKPKQSDGGTLTMPFEDYVQNMEPGEIFFIDHSKHNANALALLAKLKCEKIVDTEVIVHYEQQWSEVKVTKL